jgi:hypothetical protein
MWLAEELRPRGAAVQAARPALLSRALVARLVSGKAGSLGLVDAKAAAAGLRKASDDGLCAFVTLTGMQAAAALCAALRLAQLARPEGMQPAVAAPEQVSDAVAAMLDEVAATGRVLRPAGVPLRSSKASDASAAAGMAAALPAGTYRRETAATSRPLAQDGGGPGGAGGGAGGAGGGGGNLRVDIARMFSEKIVVLDQVNLDVESLMAASLRVALKTWLEVVREGCLSRTEFQQVQVDAHFVRLMAPMLTGDPTSVNKLVAEVVSSSRERCADPVPLDQASVDRLCNSKRESVRIFSKPT